MNKFKEEFQKHLELNFPDLKSGRSLVAVSGGVDSMTLCNLLFEAKIDFSIAHCNFQLRGTDSLRDEELVSQKSGEHGIQLHLKRFETEAYAVQKKLSIQMAARELRYKWFDQLITGHGYSFVLTAHHADDNLETFLINLSRGAGIKGLTGIPERQGKVLRPLLRFDRSDIEIYARANGVIWNEDRSNKDSKYVRNRVRHELIPVMKRVLPSLPKNFKQTLSHLKETRIIVDDKIDEVMEEIMETSSGVTKIDILKINSLPHPRSYLFEILRNFGFTQWDDIEKLLDAQPGKMVFSSTHRLLKDRDHLWLQKLDELPHQDVVYRLERSRDLLYIQSQQLSVNYLNLKDQDADQTNKCRGKRVACIDADRLAFPLTVRKRQKGDYFFPMGMKGRKKINKYFKDQKLSVPEKENIWLLCSGDDIVWIIGHRQDERYRVTEKTSNLMRIELIDSV